MYRLIMAYAFAIVVSLVNASYHYAAADACGCEKKCYKHTGVGAINPATSDIVCGKFDPWECSNGIWITNGYSTGGAVVADGANKYDYIKCADNQCQLYCIACGSNQLQYADAITQGCSVIIRNIQRHVCQTTD